MHTFAIDLVQIMFAFLALTSVELVRLSNEAFVHLLVLTTRQLFREKAASSDHHEDDDLRVAKWNQEPDKPQPTRF